MNPILFIQSDLLVGLLQIPTDIFRISFSELPLFIRTVLAVSVIALVITIVIYSVIMLWRWRGYRADLIRKQKVPEIRDLIIEHIILNPELDDNSPESIELPLAKFSKLGLHKTGVQRLLAEEIIHYKQNFSGKVCLLLKKLYTDLSLHHHAKKKLRRQDVQSVVTALNELRHMGIKVDQKRIVPLLNHKNRYVREGARCYYIKVATDEPFRFLESVSEPILPWEQVELFRIISQRNDISIPDFSAWIKPECHLTVVSFCLKLAVHFQQFEARTAIIAMLATDNVKQRAEAINALGKLMTVEAEPHLLDIYESQPFECQLEILKALGRIGSGNCLDFLYREFEQAEYIELKKHAAESIVNHHVLAEKLLSKIWAKTTGLERVILQHILNPMIKY